MYHIHLLLLLLTIFIGPATAQKDTDVLFTVNKTPITVSEFKYIYEKNNRENADYSLASIEEYLDLYINFKLKVQKARDLNYHKNETYIKELDGYRAQLADSYIIDREVIEKMAAQISKRQKWDIEIAHILISINRKANKESQKIAKNKIDAIYTQLQADEDFDRAVQMYSQDRTSTKSGGYLGYINAPLPNGYVELENAAYSTTPGEISEPIRTDQGYHIIKVLNKRPARGKMNIQHILIRNERNKIKLADALPRAKRIHEQITSGELTFDQAVRQYSEDQGTKHSGGQLGTLSVGVYERTFEDAAFALSTDGAISAPVETSIGYHIIRRVSKQEWLNKDIIRNRLKSEPLTGERFDLVHREVVESIKQEADFNENQSTLIAWAQQEDLSFYTHRWEPTPSQQKIFSFDDQEYTIDEFSAYAKTQTKKRLQAQGQIPVIDAILLLYQDFIGEQAIAYAESKLEDTYPEFNNLMREYREGILLFDVTKDFVWDKASKDTTAIKSYYATHSARYQWDERALITNYSINTVDPGLVTTIIKETKTHSPQALQEKYNGDKDVVFYAQETLERKSKELADIEWQVGQVSKPEIKSGIKMTTFKKIENIIPARPKTLKEAKGYVISDYQDQLDKEWITALHKEYKVKINKKVLNKLRRD